MKQRGTARHKIAEGIRNFFGNRVLRVFLSSTLSLFTTSIFAVYNFILWIIYRSPWSIWIAPYYMLLVAIRAFILFSERKMHRRKDPPAQREERRKTLFFIQSILLLIIDVALIAPITLMLLQEKEIHYSAVHAIAMAAYTTYKIILATFNFVKSRRDLNLSIRMLRNLSFVEALVSVLTLQYTLVVTFGDGMASEEILTLCTITSLVAWGIIILSSLFAIVKAVRLRREPTSV